MSENTDSNSGGVMGFFTENFRDLAVLAALAVAYFSLTDAEPPDLSAPDTTGLFLIGGAAAALGILFATSQIEDLIPEDHGVYLQVVNAKETDVIETWELPEEDFEEMRVVGGPLNELSDCLHRAYEVKAYNAETNVAVVTWRRSVPASQIIGHHETEDAMDMIEELREFLEPEAKRGRYIRQNLPGILRDLDRQRAVNQARAIEPQVAPSFGGESINDALDAQLPDDLKPSRLADADDHDDEQAVEVDILDEDNLMDPLATPNGENGHHE